MASERTNPRPVSPPERPTLKQILEDAKLEVDSWPPTMKNQEPSAGESHPAESTGAHELYCNLDKDHHGPCLYVASKCGAAPSAVTPPGGEKAPPDWAEKAHDLARQAYRIACGHLPEFIQGGEEAQDKIEALIVAALRSYVAYDKRLRQELDEVDRLRALLNTPETEDFDKAVPLESAHQIERWGAQHDEGKNPEDWFWLVGYLAGKALAAFKAGDLTKAKHHCISTSAALRNWHAHIRSGQSDMRPGISAEKASVGESGT